MSLIVLNGTITNTSSQGVDVLSNINQDLDLNGNSIDDVDVLTFDNTHASQRDITVEGKDGGQGGIILTAKRSLTNNRRLDLVFRQENNAGDTQEAIGSLDAVYSTTEADKRFQLRVFDSDGSAQANPHLEVRHTGDTVIRNNNIRMREIDNTDMFTVKENSSAIGGHDAQLYGAISIQPEVSTETDLSMFQLRPDYTSNSVPDGAAVKLNFQVKNDADGIVSLGKFSANYDTTVADRNFRMESPTGNNSMRFFDSHTAMEGPVQMQSISTTQRNALSPNNGWVIYNNTNNRFEFYQNGGWVYYTANSA